MYIYINIFEKRRLCTMEGSAFFCPLYIFSSSVGVLGVEVSSTIFHSFV